MKDDIDYNTSEWYQIVSMERSKSKLITITFSNAVRIFPDITCLQANQTLLTSCDRLNRLVAKNLGNRYERKVEENWKVKKLPLCHLPFPRSRSLTAHCKTDFTHLLFHRFFILPLLLLAQVSLSLHLLFTVLLDRHARSKADSLQKVPSHLYMQ